MSDIQIHNQADSRPNLDCDSKSLDSQRIHVAVVRRGHDARVIGR